MRNYELIKQIYEICMTADYRDEGHVVPEIIFNLIEKERPELKNQPATGCDYGIGG